MLYIETDFRSFWSCKTLMTFQSSLDLHQAVECSPCQLGTSWFMCVDKNMAAF